MLDKNYKKTLAKYLNLNNLKELNSIVGEEEFKTLTHRLGEISYRPVKKKFLKEVDSYDYCYLESGLFCANLHAHTKHSDGLAEVKTLLDDAAAIADKNFNCKCPFLLAITDHDTLDGTKEAIRIISSNPQKYKNLKVVLGIEISTIETKMSCLKNTLDIHTLVYCINPFDEVLNNFVKEKLDKKLKLANKTLTDLKESLNTELQKLNINLTLEEAAKIHPMITKGEDEVSHPLKKYIFGKLLFAYYVENNQKLLQRLRATGVSDEELSYEKVIHKFKSMFNNERYFYIYKEALERYVNFLANGEADIKLPEIPHRLLQTLLRGKEICEMSHPSPTRAISAFSEFSVTVKFLSSLDFGLMSIAHPARINTKNIDGNFADFFSEFFKNFKKYGKDKAYAYEKYYQSYTSKKAFEIADVIDNSAELAGLNYTGGIDSHGYNVYTRCTYS